MASRAKRIKHRLSKATGQNEIPEKVIIVRDKERSGRATEKASTLYMPYIPHDVPAKMNLRQMQQAAVPLEYFDIKQSEWKQERDNLMQGLLLYRFKYEELDKNIQMLPVPIKEVVTELQQKEEALEQAKQKHQEELQEKDIVLSSLTENFDVLAKDRSGDKEKYENQISVLTGKLREKERNRQRMIAEIEEFRGTKRELLKKLKREEKKNGLGRFLRNKALRFKRFSRQQKRMLWDRVISGNRK